MGHDNGGVFPQLYPSDDSYIIYWLLYRLSCLAIDLWKRVVKFAKS